MLDKVRTDPLTLTALIAWLEGHNPEEKYSYGNSHNCWGCPQTGSCPSCERAAFLSLTDKVDRYWLPL